jgi:cell surface protein SprA
LPPGIDRQVLSGNAGAQRQNEASLYLKANPLLQESKRVFKNTTLDMRRYKKLKLFVHAHDPGRVIGFDKKPNSLSVSVVMLQITIMNMKLL